MCVFFTISIPNWYYLRLGVWLKLEMTGTKFFQFLFYMIPLISELFQAIWHIQQGSGPHFTLSEVGLLTLVGNKGWKCKNGKSYF